MGGGVSAMGDGRRQDPINVSFRFPIPHPHRPVSLQPKSKFDVGRAGGLTLDQNFLIEFEDGMRPHQVRLQGGDASSDSFCFS